MEEEEVGCVCVCVCVKRRNEIYLSLCLQTQYYYILLVWVCTRFVDSVSPVIPLLTTAVVFLRSCNGKQHQSNYSHVNINGALLRCDYRKKKRSPACLHFRWAAALPGPIIFQPTGFTLPFSRQEHKSIFVQLEHWFFPLGGFHFPGTGVLHFKLAISMFSGQVHQHVVQNIDASPPDDIHHIVRVCMLSVCLLRGESCRWHCPGGGAAEPALGWILFPVGRPAGVAGLPGKGTHTMFAHCNVALSASNCVK